MSLISRAISRLPDLLRAFQPPQLAVTQRELWLGSVGMAIGLLMTELLCRLAGGPSLSPWFIAPIGASAMLVFFMPASPPAQPWCVVVGNGVSAVLGVAFFSWFGPGGEVAAVAAAAATAAMFLLRCLHPPGAAVAITGVIGGPAIHALGWHFVLWPVAVNSVVLVLLGLVLNNAAARRYPHHHVHAPAVASLPTNPGGIVSADLDAAIASFDELLDIDREDLEEIVARAQREALRRQGALPPA